MRTASFFILSLCIYLGLPKVSFAQTMDVDANLNSESDVYSISFKPLNNYSFGPYKIIKRAKGDLKVKDSELYEKYKSTNEIRNKQAFSVVCNELDTFQVVQIKLSHLIDKEKRKVWTVDEVHIPRQRVTVRYFKESLLTSFSSKNNGTKWNLLLTNPSISESETEGFTIDSKRSNNQKFYEEFDFDGELSSDNTLINIRQLKELNSEKSIKELILEDIVYGYEFILNGRAIAAVQLAPHNLNKMKVWIRKELDNDIKNVIATAICAKLLDR
jgi:hypothetical protein